MDIKEYELLQSLSINSFTQRAIKRMGHKHSTEARKKISEANSRRIRTKEYKENVSASLKAFYADNVEARKLLALRSTGKHHTEEAKEKIRAARLGKKASKETSKKLSLAHKDKVISEETRKKISQANKGKVRGPQSEEHKRKIRESCRISLEKKKALAKAVN